MGQILDLNGRKWVAGMTWRSFEDAPNKSALQEDAAALNADWYALRENDTAIQAGFCTPLNATRHPHKLFSLAALLADSMQQPWLGIFQIEERLWWYIAVRDGHAILPDGDVIGDRDTIFAARERHSGYTDWNYIEGTITDLLALMVKVEKKPVKIRSLKFPMVSSRKLQFLALGIVMVIGAASYLWYRHIENVRAHERAEAMARMRMELANQPVQKAPSPLLTTPDPSAWLESCASIIMPLPISLYGWMLEDISCSAQTVNVTWRREPGADVSQKPDGLLSIEGDKVIQSIPMAGLMQKGMDNSIALDDAMLILRTQAQRLGLSLTMTKVMPPAPKPGENKPVVQTAPEATFRVASRLSPFRLDLVNVPGLRFDSVKTSGAEGWITEGHIYGR